MSLRTLTLITAIVMSATGTIASAQHGPDKSSETSPSSIESTLLAALQSAPSSGEFTSLVNPSGQPDWYSKTSHTTEHSSPASYAAFVETSETQECCASEWEPQNTNKWDFSQGLLTCFHQDTAHRYTGFLDFNYYYDTRDFNILTINAGAKLPHDFEYFQFVNYRSQFGNESDLENWTDFLRKFTCGDQSQKTANGSVIWTGQ